MIQSTIESGGHAGYEEEKRRNGSKVHVALAEAVQESVERAYADQGCKGEEAFDAAWITGLSVGRLAGALAGRHYVAFNVLMLYKAASLLAEVHGTLSASPNNPDRVPNTLEIGLGWHHDTRLEKRTGSPMRFQITAMSVCAVIGVWFAQAFHEARASESDSLSASVDDYVSQFMKRHHLPGVSVAVCREGTAILTKSYGHANVEHRVPATEETVYQLASVTKTFTASAIMLLVKDGELALDDKISDRLSDLPRAWETVTVRHLLNHTSGIKNYTSVQGFNKTPEKDFTPREILDLVATAPMDFMPGEKWLYSNTGYVLLGMLIEQTAGKPYGEFMAERIFKPLGMTHTRANDLRVILMSRAQGYQWDGKTLRNSECVNPTQPFAAGMLVSTLSDLIKWEAALAGRTILDESTLERMWAATRLNDGKEAGYGFGWEVSKVNGHRLLSHGGAIPGFSTEITRFIDDKLTVIVLTNADGGRADGLARGIARLYLPALAVKPVEPIADNDAQTTERLRGMFEGALKGEFDEALFTDQAKTKLIPAIKADQARLASFGALQTFQLLERKEQNQGLHVQYQAVLENMTVKLTFDLDKTGRIRGAGMQLED